MRRRRRTNNVNSARVKLGRFSNPTADRRRASFDRCINVICIYIYCVYIYNMKNICIHI